MVFPDQFSPRALGFKGEMPVKTPNLDEFSKDALVLENAVSNHPICSPYRAMMMTSRYPWKTGVTANCNTARSKYGMYLKRTETCVTDVFSQNGYDVGYIGKWHLDPPEKSHLPYISGWRELNAIWDSYTIKKRRHSINFWHAYGADDNHLAPHYWHNDAPVEDVIRPDCWSVEHEAGVAIDYIKNKDNCRDSEKPFVLFVSHNPPHSPYDEIPQKYKDIYKDEPVEKLLTCPNVMYKNPAEIEDKKDDKGGERAEEAIHGYFSAVTGVDENFGRIIQTLKDEGLYDDTIIIFTSDHGDLMGSHNMMGKNSWYSESFKVPFIIRYPEKIKNGKSDAIFNTPDIMPTLLSLCGMENKIPNTVQGKDKIAYLSGEKDGDDTTGLYFHFNDWEHARGIKTKRYTFVAEINYALEETFFLYDDLNDPWQLCNIADDNMEVCEKLHEEMLKQLEILEYDRM